MAVAIAAVIRKIPRGRVSTYGAVAEAAGFPRCARHVAQVLRRVPGLPWQRVLGAGGRIVIPGEYGFEQRFLLQTEGVRFKGKRVDIAAYGYQFRTRRRSVASRRR